VEARNHGVRQFYGGVIELHPPTSKPGVDAGVNGEGIIVVGLCLNESESNYSPTITIW